MKNKKAKPIPRRAVSDFPAKTYAPGILPQGTAVQALDEITLRGVDQQTSVRVTVDEIGSYEGLIYLPFNGQRHVVKFARLTAFLKRDQFKQLE